MAAFLTDPRTNSRDVPRAKLQKKALQTQPVENNTYTPNAVSYRVIKSSPRKRKSAASLSTLMAMSNPRPSEVLLAQMTRTTRALLSIDAGTSMPKDINIGKPKFVKRNDSPIHRFPSQKEESLVMGTLKLVQLEGDVIPGPGVKLKQKTPGPIAVPEERMRVLKVINLPNPDVKAAFEDIPRAQTPPPPLAASRPVPIRQTSFPLVSTTDADTPVPMTQLPISLLAKIPKPQPNYRGVAASRFGGSIPYRDADLEVPEPIIAVPTRSSASKPPATIGFRSSPSWQQHRPKTPTSPPHTTSRLFSTAIAEQIPKPGPKYRGVAAFRYGGSIPGSPEDPRPPLGRPVSLNNIAAHKPLSLRTLRASPLSQEHLLYTPTSPPHTTSRLLSRALPEQSPKPGADYRGVAAFRYGGSIPGSPEDPRPPLGRPLSLNNIVARKAPSLRTLGASPLSHEHLPTSSTKDTKSLMVPQSRETGLRDIAGAGVNLQRENGPMLRRQASLDILEQTVLVARKEVERLQRQNNKMYRRLEALEDKTSNGDRDLLDRIAALEELHSSVMRELKVDRAITTSEVSQHTDKTAALKAQIAHLRGENNELTALVKGLSFQNDELVSWAEKLKAEAKETLDASIKAKEEAELNAENASRKVDTILKTIEVIEHKSMLDRRSCQGEKEHLTKQVASLRADITSQEASCAKHLLDIRSKNDELRMRTKENDRLQKEINVLWEELEKSSQKADKDSKKKIDELEAKVAEISDERTRVVIEKGKLKKEVEVLWGEIREMHEKQATLAKAVRGTQPQPQPPSVARRPYHFVPPRAAQPESNNNAPLVFVSVLSTPLESQPPQIIHSEPLTPGLDVHKLAPHFPPLIESDVPTQLSAAELRRMVGGFASISSPVVGTVATGDQKDSAAVDQQQKQPVDRRAGRGKFGHEGMGMFIGGTGRIWRPPGQGPKES